MFNFCSTSATTKCGGDFGGPLIQVVSLVLFWYKKARIGKTILYGIDTAVVILSDSHNTGENLKNLVFARQIPRQTGVGWGFPMGNLTRNILAPHLRKELLLMIRPPLFISFAGGVFVRTFVTGKRLFDWHCGKRLRLWW